MGFPRTHIELDALAAARGIEFPAGANVEAKQEQLQEAGVDPEQGPRRFRIASADGEPVNYVEIAVHERLVRIEGAEVFVSADPHVAAALDAHPYVEEVEG